MGAGRTSFMASQQASSVRNEANIPGAADFNVNQRPESGLQHTRLQFIVPTGGNPNEQIDLYG